MSKKTAEEEERYRKEMEKYTLPLVVSKCWCVCV